MSDLRWRLDRAGYALSRRCDRAVALVPAWFQLLPLLPVKCATGSLRTVSDLQRLAGSTLTRAVPHSRFEFERVCDSEKACANHTCSRASAVTRGEALPKIERAGVLAVSSPYWFTST